MNPCITSSTACNKSIECLVGLKFGESAMKFTVQITWQIYKVEVNQNLV